MWKAHHMWCIFRYHVMIPVHMQCQVVHPFPPVADSGSRVLILGSFPSVKSRQDGFYYAHPHNRFWPMMEKLFSCRLADIDEKKALLHRVHIALWDSIASCTITGSSDSSIRDVVAADIGRLVGSTCIDTILANGTKHLHRHDSRQRDEVIRRVHEVRVSFTRHPGREDALHLPCKRLVVA